MIKINDYILKSKKERQDHIKLEEPCVHRGGCSTQFRGILAFYLGTEIPVGNKVCCCHACDNESCSNPNHLYWGTRKENTEDSILLGTHASVSRHGYFSIENPNTGKMPWETNNAKESDWLKAKEIYETYIVNGWDFSQYGKGPSYLQENYNISIGASKTMIKLLRSGWNPNNDERWIDVFTEGKDEDK